jgi:phage-related protein
VIGGVEAVAGKFREWREGTSNIGELRDRLNPFVDMLKSGLRFIGAVAGALMALGGAAGGNGLLEWLTGLVQKFTAWMQSAEGQNAIKQFFDDVLPAVKSVMTFVGLLITALVVGFQIVAPALKFVLDGFNLILKVVIWLMRQILRIPAPIRALAGIFFPFGGVLRGIIGIVAKIFPAFSRLAGGIRGVMRPVIEWLRSAFGALPRVVQAVVSRMGGIFNTLMGLVRGGINIFIGVLNFLIRALNKIQVKVPDWVPGFGGKQFGFNIGEIPTLASGGMVTSDTLARIGEAGREAVLPLRGAVLRQIGTAIAAAMPGGTRAGGVRAAGAGAGGGGVHIERVVLPPPPKGGIPDPRYAAVQFAQELSRRGGIA